MAEINRDKEALITQEYLKSILEYNPDTGEFIRLVRTANCTQISDIVGTLDKSTGYIRISICNISYRAHRLAWLYMTGEWPKYKIDHIDRIRSNNQVVNLRDINKNEFNKGFYKNNNIGIVGVTIVKSLRYKAVIGVNGKGIYLGTFDTLEEASIAYEEAKLKYHII